MTLIEKYKDSNIILATKSPRRQDLFRGYGLKFKVEIKEVREVYPDNLTDEQIAIYLAELKSSAFNTDNYPRDTIIITADTIVCINNQILGKPKDYNDANSMLSLLSGNTHNVITGVCIKSYKKTKSFASHSDVTFKLLSLEEIEYYLDKYKPYDKAGAYGVQEWIGYIGIEKINGSYFNVMGLPTKKLYEELMMF